MIQSKPPLDSPTSTDPQTNSADGATGSENAVPTRRPRRWLLRFILLVSILIVAGLIWNGMSSPKVEDDGREVTIQHAPDSGSSDENADSDLPIKGDEPVDAQRPRLTSMISDQAIADADHPLHPLIELGQECLVRMDENVVDYQAKLTTQILKRKKLLPEKKMEVKVRHAREDTDGNSTPFSVYTRFIRPRSEAGQEAIWVDGANDGKLLAHASGFLNVKTFHLDPLSSMAMKSSRYPIYQVGFRKLILKMLEYGKSDQEHDECEVSFERNVIVDGHQCTLLQVIHPAERDHFEYHIAKIYIDDEREFPIGYEGFLWPEKPGEEPRLLERYFYTDIKLNVGLTDLDFDPANEKYEYPGW